MRQQTHKLLQECAQGKKHYIVYGGICYGFPRRHLQRKFRGRLGGAGDYSNARCTTAQHSTSLEAFSKGDYGVTRALKSGGERARERESERESVS